MYVLIMMEKQDGIPRRFVSPHKKPLNKVLAMWKEKYGEDGFHYRWWKQGGFFDGSEDAWKYLHLEGGTATLVF